MYPVLIEEIEKILRFNKSDIAHRVAKRIDESCLWEFARGIALLRPIESLYHRAVYKRKKNRLRGGNFESREVDASISILAALIDATLHWQTRNRNIDERQ